MVHSKTKPATAEVPKVEVMEYILYKMTSPSGRTYIGVTNDFKRRVKEHYCSKWPIGHALRKYGKHNFEYEFEFYDTVEEVLNREKQLVTKEKLGKQLYNVTVGGNMSDVLKENNPMHDPNVLASHPNLWTTQNNPMNNSDSKRKMIESQACKKVSIDGIIYYGVREAARQLNSYRQLIVHRLRSKNYPTWYYI